MARVISSRDRLLETPSGVRLSPRMQLTLVGLAAIALVIFLIVRATVQTSMYYLTVEEFAARQDTLAGQRVRLNGLVVPDSEQWNATATRLDFQLYEVEGGTVLPVVYHGPRPDNFRPGTSAIVEGALDADGHFVADSLLLKCPSRYEEGPEEIYMEAA